jgi:carotenoid 1,2-hydratase
MNISTAQKDEDPFQNKPSGGYEWWYFDAISADKEWSLVIIFYQGNPFSPRYIQAIEAGNTIPDEFPAVSISIYHNTKTEFYSFIEYTQNDFKWDEEKSVCTIGPHSFSKEVTESTLNYKLSMNEQLLSGHKISGKIEFSGRPSLLDIQPEKKEQTEHHFWNLLQYSAQVKGHLEVAGKSGSHSIDFKGTGYHDHNIGLEPMKNDFEDWYWGRYHFKDSTLIYYVMNRKEDKQYQAWLISNDSDSVIDRFDTIELEENAKNIFGLSSDRKLVFSSKDTTVTIHATLPIDDGPFYQRFLGQAVMKRHDLVDVSNGFSEYIYPQNIYRRLFWPAVKMRLRFNDQKPHWVQKFKSFYEWTW